MGSEYDPVFRGSGGERLDDMETVRAIFARASRPFTSSPWSWWTWAVLLPAVALATGPLLERFGPSGAVIGWCSVILVGGGVEMWVVRARRDRERTTLATWALRSQANLSFVAAVLSILLLWHGRAEALPGLWLLVLGHSFLQLGSLAFQPFRRAGWIYQLAGIGALWPGQEGLVWFAAATGLGNLAIGLGVWAAARGE